MERNESSVSLRQTAASTSSANGYASKVSNGSSSSLRVSNSVAKLTSYVTGKGISKWLTLSVEGPGLNGQVHANNDQDVACEETGDWQYLVVDPAGIRAREDAIYNKKSKKNGDSNRYKEGSVCAVNRRRIAGWTTWLSLKNGDGWLFDVSPKDKKVRLVEVEVAKGSWHYECIADRVPVLSQPQMNFAGGKSRWSFSSAKVFLTNGEVVHMEERVRPLNGKGSFLRLADGRGWAVDFVDGQQVLNRQMMAGDSSISPGPSGNGTNGYVQSSSSTASVVNVKPFAASVHPLLHQDGDALPGVGSHLGQAESGEWDYIVVDPKGITLRSSPTYDESYKMNKRIDEGEVVVVLERIPGDGTTFLRLASPSGWCFERTPSRASNKVQKLRMVEIQVDKGLWYYSVVAEKGVALRSRCTFSESSKIAKGPLKGALCEVTERVRVGESTFLKMKDGSGWIFDVKNRKKILDGPIQMQVLPPNSLAAVNNQDGKNNGIHLLSSPTKQSFAKTKFYVINGAKVRASMICEVENTKWIFVARNEGGGGIEGWASADMLLLELPLEVPSDRLTPKAPTEEPAILNTALSHNRLPPSQAWGGSASTIIKAQSPSSGYVNGGCTGGNGRLEAQSNATRVSVASVKSDTSLSSFAEDRSPPTQGWSPPVLQAATTTTCFLR